MEEIISPEKLLIKVSSILDDLGIKYFVTGGFAVSVWGRPRATFDIDIVIQILEPKVSLLIKALRKISKAGYIEEDAALEAIRKKGEFNFIDPDTGFKVDFWIMKESPSVSLEYKRRVKKTINRQNVYFISPEDLILSKLVWYQKSESTRHVEDAESVIKILGKKLDFRYLKKRVKELGISEIWDKLI